MFWRRANYPFNTVEGIVDMAKGPAYLKDGVWFVGVTANAVSSLTAHKIDTTRRAAFDFECWDIPFEHALECKEALLHLEDHNFISDDRSDFIDGTYPNSFIYLYKVRDWKINATVEHIDISGFKPVPSLPPIPISVTEISTEGEKSDLDYGDEFDLEKFLKRIKYQFMRNHLQHLAIEHRNSAYMVFDFGQGCCTVSYRSPNEEGIQSYRSGDTSRKQTVFFDGKPRPEYMICRDREKFLEILRYFLEKSAKPGKRQGIKWVRSE